MEKNAAYFKDDDRSSSEHSSAGIGIGNFAHGMTIEARKMSKTVMWLVVLTSFCGFMFGYDTGYISGALVVIKSDLGHPLSTGNKEFITSATSLGALISAVLSGALADVIGRRPVVMVADILFIVGAIIQTAAHTMWTMIAGRFVMGLGVGMASLVAPIFISELAPSKYRGRLVVLNVLAITAGQLIAYAIGAGLNDVANGWRIMVGLSMVPATFQMILFFYMPETPRFLASKHRIDDARAVLGKVYLDSSDAELDDKVQTLIQYSTADPKLAGKNVLQRAWIHYKELHTVPSNLRALIITCGLQGIQQFSGWNSLMYFSATVFQSVGFKNSIAVSIVLSGTNFVFTIIAFLIIDKVGKRKLLLCTVWGMSLGLVLNAIAFHFIDINSPSNNTNGWSILTIISMLVFAAFYASGIGNVPWQQSEMFPMSVRGVGSSMATATNWAGSLIVSSTFLTMLDNITPTGTYAFYAGLCIIGELFIYFLYPETSGMTIEDVQATLAGGFNVKESVKRQKKLAKYYNHINEEHST